MFERHEEIKKRESGNFCEVFGDKKKAAIAGGP
jgi:hypothetical protein